MCVVITDEYWLLVIQYWHFSWFNSFRDTLKNQTIFAVFFRNSLVFYLIHNNLGMPKYLYYFLYNMKYG